MPKGIPKIYLLGDTGAGKTTFIRKILGTENTKFPTTRQSRTTIAPTEYVICKSPNYELTILLKSFDEINGYVREILKEALEKSLKSEDVKKSLRQTNDQRFRLYYLLDVSDIANFAEEVISLTPLLSEKIDELKEIFNDDITDQDEYISFAIDELNDKVECIQNNIMDSIQSNVMS
ncbi:TPA: tRNA (adenosine(37)-N6)-threonylcarbamoyltransferase complex ATPase subunit type 1 TsaE, partial [Citrobacter freundii]|nr:tRNA (adenosine(37)-N6)-threonylcarbamoyltransferase complex ATPase subunit type 1 TsaE [Citrobacter freundii]